ncbi:MAG: hypothetical protein U0228_25140 [Myxococcaceae bacterium]
MSVDAILAQLQEISFAGQWHGPHPVRPASDLPARFEQLLHRPNIELRASMSADFTLGGLAYEPVVPILFALLQEPEVGVATRRFLARALGLLAWKNRWLFHEPSVPDDEELDADAALVLLVKPPPGFLEGDREVSDRIYRQLQELEQPTELPPRPTSIADGTPEIDRLVHLRRFGITLGQHYVADQRVRARVGELLERSALLEDADVGVAEETLVTACSFPRRAATLGPRLWKIVEGRPPLAAQALLGLAFMGDPKVQEACVVFGDQLDPRDARAALYLAAADVFSAKGQPSRQSRSLLSKPISPELRRQPCVFGGTLDFLIQRTLERAWPKKR